MQFPDTARLQLQLSASAVWPSLTDNRRKARLLEVTNRSVHLNISDLMQHFTAIRGHPVSLLLVSLDDIKHELERLYVLCAAGVCTA